MCVCVYMHVFVRVSLCEFLCIYMLLWSNVCTVELCSMDTLGPIIYILIDNIRCPGLQFSLYDKATITKSVDHTVSLFLSDMINRFTVST